MKLQQIQFIVEIARSGSISQAAKSLYTSQSNVSHALKVLENELGFAIFTRTKDGVRITEKGQQLLTLADTVYQLFQKMEKLGDSNVNRSFNVAADQYSFCHEAFLKLCIAYQNIPGIDLCMRHAVNKFHLCDLIAQKKCEIGLILVSPVFFEAYERKIRQHGLEVVFVRDVPLYVRLARNHPLLKTMQEDGTINFAELSKYPCVDYNSEDQVLRYILDDVLGLSMSLEEIKHINVFDREYKRKIISETNAWTVGVSHSAQLESLYDGARIPVPGVGGRIVCLKREGEGLSREAKCYLLLLEEEFSALEQIDGQRYVN